MSLLIGENCTNKFQSIPEKQGYSFCTPAPPAVKVTKIEPMFVGWLSGFDCKHLECAESIFQLRLGFGFQEKRRLGSVSILLKPLVRFYWVLWCVDCRKYDPCNIELDHENDFHIEQKNKNFGCIILVFSYSIGHGNWTFGFRLKDVCSVFKTDSEPTFGFQHISS